MSLINDALKKAQRLRQEQEAAGAAGAPQAGRSEKRGSGLSTQTLIILGVTATVLVVISVVGTVFWVNRPPAPKPALALAALKPAPTNSAKPTEPANVVVLAPPSSGKSEPNVAVTPPATKPAPETSAPATLPNPGAANAAPDSNLAVTVPPPTAQPQTAGATPAATLNPATLFRERVGTPAPAATPPPPALPQPDARIQAFVDAIKVSGVRSSGSESRVLMNDRVYRINDLVDRALGVKLTKVTADTLTFTDSNGFTYTKSL